MAPLIERANAHQRGIASACLNRRLLRNDFQALRAIASQYRQFLPRTGRTICGLNADADSIGPGPHADTDEGECGDLVLLIPSRGAEVLVRDAFAVDLKLHRRVERDARGQLECRRHDYGIVCRREDLYGARGHGFNALVGFELISARTLGRY
jgi:hypothetical protein